MIRQALAAGLTAALFITALPAQAGGSASIASEGEDMRLEYTDNKVRMHIAGQGDNAYMLLLDDRVYSVAGDLVIDASSMLQQFSDQAPTPGDSMASFHGLEATGRTESVAGIRGEVYVVDFTDGDGRRQQKEAVLSDDKRAVDMQRAFMHFVHTMSQASGGLDGAKDLEEALGERGILRMGKQMRVAEISGETPPDARFELPSEPRSLGDFGAAFGN